MHFLSFYLFIFLNYSSQLLYNMSQGEQRMAPKYFSVAGKSSFGKILQTDPASLDRDSALSFRQMLFYSAVDSFGRAFN